MFALANSVDATQYPFDYDWETANKTEIALNPSQASSQQKYDAYQDEEKLIYRIPDTTSLREPATSGESEVAPTKETPARHTD